MADERDEAPAAPKPRYRRPAPTIDLKATEVAVEPSGEPEPAAAPTEEGPRPAAESAAPDRAAASEQPEQQESERSAPEKPGAPGPWGMPPDWTHAIAGALGGLAVVVLAIVLWAVGVFAPAANGDSAGLQRRLSRLEAQTKEIAERGSPSAPDSKALDALNARLAKLEQAIASAAAQPAPAVPANADQLAATDTAIKALQANVAALAQRADDIAAATREARGQADAAMQAAAQNAQQNNIEALGKRVASLEQSIKSLADEITKQRAPTADRSLRAAIAAQALRGAAERGDPYAAELAALKPLVSDARKLAPLEGFAKSGLPPASVLAQQLSELAPVLQQHAEPQATGSFLDRLKSNAGRLVRIRPISETPGDDPPAVISRAEADAARGDIAGAAAELEKLSADVRAPADDWIKRAQARNAALAASRQLESESLAALGEPTP